jgi:hypothetical protein
MAGKPAGAVLNIRAVAGKPTGALPNILAMAGKATAARLAEVVRIDLRRTATERV